MAHIGRTVKIDENVLRYNQVKMPGKLTAEVGVQRRAALGELGNRVKNPIGVLDGKKPALGDLKLNIAATRPLKDIKSRVDTHWRKDANAVNKPLTRTDSVKLSAIGTTRSALTTAATIGQPRLVRTRTLQTAKPEVAQRVTRIRPDNGEQQQQMGAAVAAAAEKPSVAQQVRRQESNLTRRSLTKLRAAMQKDKLQQQQQQQPSHKAGSGSESAVSSSTESLNAQLPAVVGFVAAPESAHSTISFLDIENIDANDEGTLFLVSEYVNDIYSYMFKLEAAHPIRANYLLDQREVTYKMRGVLVDWLNEVHLQFKLQQETFFMAVAIIDRYLQVVKTTSRKNLQLVGVTSLFIASKYEELYPPEIRDFVYITDDTYDKKQILDMERHIFKKLEFNMGRPLPIHFLRRFAKAAHSGNFSDGEYQMAKYFIELAAVDYSLVQYLPSEVAGASLLLTLHLMDPSGGTQSVWNKTIQYYTTYTEQQLQPIVHKLALVVKEAPNSKLHAVYNKYMEREISTHPLLTTTNALDQIIAATKAESA